MATNFQKISEKYEINQRHRGWDDGEEGEAYMYEGEAPCFVYRAYTDDRMTKEEIPVYLRACARENIGVMIISVTEKDANYKEYIAAAKAIKGATVTRGRSTNHGGYPCWLIALPGTAKN